MSEPASSPATSQCTTLACDSVGLLITILQLGQFIPQHYEMAVDRSVVGVSPWLLFFSSLYTFLAALDIMILGAGATFTCGDGAYRCFIEGQPLLQMCGSAALSISMWYWYLKYHRESSDITDSEERRLLGSFFYGSFTARAFYNAFLVIAGFFSFLALALACSFGWDSPAAVSFAHWCGWLAAILNAVMWAPQIIVTYTFGHKGALSMGWVLASVIMDVAYSVYLATMGMHWSVWVNNVPDGVQTAILLVLLLWFEYRDRKRGVDDYGRIISSSDTGDYSGAEETKSRHTGTRLYDSGTKPVAKV